jgi:hypothetical protein
LRPHEYQKDKKTPEDEKRSASFDDLLGMGGLNNIQLLDEEEKEAPKSSEKKPDEDKPPTPKAPKTPLPKQKFRVRAGSTSPLNKDGIGATRWEDWNSTRKPFGAKKHKLERKVKLKSI